MNFKISLLMVLMLITLGWSFNIADYLSHNESSTNIVSIDMIGPQGAYIMYYLDNKPLLMVYDNVIVTDTTIIKTVLERYYFEKDFFEISELEEIQATALLFNESRSYPYNDGRYKTPPGTNPERYCRQITGSLLRECYDKQSCLLTCSASPVCKMAIEGSPNREEFLQGIQYLQDDSNQFDDDIFKIMEITDEFKNIEYTEYNDNIKNKISDLINRMANIKDTTTHVRNNVLFLDALPAPGLQPLFCYPVNYSTTAENELDVLANTYSSKMENLFEIEELVKTVKNETDYRINLKVILATENEYTTKYNSADSKYQVVYSKYVKVNKYVEDVELRGDINLLKKHLDSARDNIYSGEFSKADLSLRQFELLSTRYDGIIDNYFVDVSAIELLQTKVDKKFIMAEWDVSGLIFQLGPQLNDLKIKRTEIDKKISAKVKPDELEGIKSEYEEIYNEINDIIKVKREQMLDTTLTSLVMKSNDFSNSFATILGSIGMDYETRKTSREYVFPLTLIVGSLLVVGGFMSSFVYLVGSGKVRLHKIAAMLWSFIFISFFITVSGGAIGTYLLINEKSVKSTFDTFYYNALLDDTIVIVLDEKKGAIPDGCASELTRVLEQQMNKTIIYYKINHNECLLMPDLEGNLDAETLTFEECEERMDPFTKIRLVKDESPSTTFTFKYTSEAIIAGDNNYINSCQLAIILDEEI